MAIWDRNKVAPSALNGGNEYVEGDFPTEETLNAANNNAFYAVDFTEALADAPDNTEAGNIGTPTVTLIDNVKTIDGTPKTFKKFKFANLKGEKGDAGINDALVVQELGTSTENAISQKVITDKFDDIDDQLNQLNSVPVSDTAYGLIEAFENAEAGVMQNLLIKGRTLTNLIANGNFSNGTTGWTVAHAGINLIVNENGNLQCTTINTSFRVSILQSTTINLGEKYFFYSKMATTLSSNQRFTMWLGQGAYPTIKTVDSEMNAELYTTFTPTEPYNSLYLSLYTIDGSNLPADEIFEIDGNAGVFSINMTANGIEDYTETQMLNLVHGGYFDGTKSTDKGEVSVGAGTAITRARYPKLQSVPAITDTFDVLGGVHTKNVQDVAITSGTAVNTTNYPLAKNAVGFVIALTAGGIQTGTVGTDSASGNGVLYYQLAEPVLSYYPPKSIPLEINSTIEHNPIISDIAFYSTGFTITDTNYPISALEEVFKVDEETGVETPIAVSTCTVASGGLSFTSTALTNGDLVWIRYSHENGSIIPTTEYTYTTSISGGLATIQQDLKKQNESLQKQIDELRAIIASMAV